MFKNPRSFPATRLRRLRMKRFLRNLAAENSLSVKNLIMPIFVCENDEKDLNISSIQGLSRIRLVDLAGYCQRLFRLGIPAVALFPVIPAQDKTDYSSAAYDKNGLIPRAIDVIKQKVAELGVITDVALDPYSKNGQDGITNTAGQILNDATLDTLCRQSLCLARAGSDLLAPSDMMDGRIGAIRQCLDANSYTSLPILSYAAKYASGLYSPFRLAIGSAANLGKSAKQSYQINPANSNEALHEAALDLQEGADILMVKPGNMYLDVIWRLSQEFNVPVFAYQVSGEYSMLKSLGGDDQEQQNKVIMESLISLKRSGAAAIISYFAMEAAQILSQ